MWSSEPGKDECSSVRGQPCASGMLAEVPTLTAKLAEQGAATHYRVTKSRLTKLHSRDAPPLLFTLAPKSQKLRTIERAPSLTGQV